MLCLDWGSALGAATCIGEQNTSQFNNSAPLSSVPCISPWLSKFANSAIADFY